MISHHLALAAGEPSVPSTSTWIFNQFRQELGRMDQSKAAKKATTTHIVPTNNTKKGKQLQPSSG